MSKARGKVQRASSYSNLREWLDANAHWYFAELARVPRPDWVQIAKLIADDGVHASKDAVRVASNRHPGRNASHAPIKPHPQPNPQPQPIAQAPASDDAQQILSKLQSRYRGNIK